MMKVRRVRSATSALERESMVEEVLRLLQHVGGDGPSVVNCILEQQSKAARTFSRVMFQS